MKIYKYGRLKIANVIRNNLMQTPKLRNLFWECTLKCNAKCKHCGSNAENKEYDNELTTNEIKEQLLKISQRYDAKDILINITGGEPLVRKDLFDVMEYAKGLGYSWGMTTNGMIITPEIIEKMRMSGMDTVSISLDGLRETHDDFRGVKGSYDKILENVILLKKAGFVRVIQITTVVNKKNLEQLQELYEIIKTLEIDSWRIVNMDPIGRANENNDLLLDKEDYKILLDFIKKIRKEKKLHITYGCSHFVGLNYELDVRDECFLCFTGITVGSILHNGDIFVCPNVARLPHLIQGNIRENDFCDVWENEYKVFRNENRTSCEKCKNCDDWQFCYGGAYHTWNHEEGKQNICLEGLA